MLFDIYRKIRTEDWSNGVLECWSAGLGDCTAEALRAQSKEFLIKKYSDLCELGREKKSPSALRPGSGQTAKCSNYQLPHPVCAEPSKHERIFSHVLRSRAMPLW